MSMPTTDTRFRAKVDPEFKLVALATADLTLRVKAHYRGYYGTYAIFRGASTAGAGLRELIGLDRARALIYIADFRVYLKNLGASRHRINDHVSALRRAVRQAKLAGLTSLDLGRRKPQEIASVQPPLFDQDGSLVSPSAKRTKPVAIATLMDSIMDVGDPHKMSKGYYTKMKKAFGTLSSSGLESTADLTSEAIHALEAAWEGTEAARRDVMNSIHRICAIAIEMGCLALNPVPRTRVPYERPIPKRSVQRSKRGVIPEASDVKRLLANLSAQAGTWKGFRLYALIATVVYMDLFHSEAISLKPSDVDLTRWIITVNHGRRGPLVLPIPTELRPLLSAWLPWAGKDWLFPGRAKSSRWTSDSGPCGVSGQIKQAGLDVGIEGLTFESLRRFRFDNPALSPLIEPGIGKNVWLIMGDPMEPLGDKGQEFAEAFYIAWKAGKRLTQAEVFKINPNYRKVIHKEMEEKHPHWLAIIDRSHERGKRGDFGLKDPRPKG